MKVEKLIQLENGSMAGLKSDFNSKEVFVASINIYEKNQNELTVEDITEGYIDTIKEEFRDECEWYRVWFRTGMICTLGDSDKIEKTEECYIFFA